MLFKLLRYNFHDKNLGLPKKLETFIYYENKV